MTLAQLPEDRRGAPAIQTSRSPLLRSKPIGGHNRGQMLQKRGEFDHVAYSLAPFSGAPSDSGQPESNPRGEGILPLHKSRSRAHQD